MRRRRQWIAALLVFGLAFAQVVTAAHACSVLGSPPGTASVAHAVDHTMPADCPEMAQSAESTVNVCVSHCEFGEQVDAHADAAIPAVAPQPPLVVRLVDTAVPGNGEPSSLVAALAAPPAQLLFSRFLI